MTALAQVPVESFDLRTLVDRATTILVNARTAAEILEAREIAGFAYDVAKRASRLSDDAVGQRGRSRRHAQARARNAAWTATTN